MKNSIWITLFMFFGPLLIAQDDEIYTSGTFRSAQLINMQTVEMTPVGGPEFIIRHRFGLISPDSTVYQQFLGLDGSANIRLGFAYAPTSRMSFGIGRTKSGKTIDGEVKYLLLRQREDGKMPISVALFASAAVMSDKFPAVAPYSFYNDSITPFVYHFAHRLSYDYEIILARRFGEKVSLQLTPSLIWRNLAMQGHDNYTAILTLGGVYRTGLTSSVIFEYSYRFNNAPTNSAYPLSVAWEFGTAGHIFQLVLSSTNEIVWQDLQSTDGFNYLKGKFCIGFNIKRYMWHKDQQPVSQ